MASYSFAGSNPGLFGGGGIWGSNWGTPVVTGINAGFDVSQKLRTLQNQAALDPFTIPAIAAQADATRLNADLQSSGAENTLSAILRALQTQSQSQQPAAPTPDPAAAAVVAANDQAMQDQKLDQLMSPILQRAVKGSEFGTLNQMLRIPQYQMEMPGFGPGGGYGF